MKRLMVFVAAALLLQSCVEEVENPFGQSYYSESDYWIVTNETEICQNWIWRTYLIYGAIQEVDSVQWNPTENINYQLNGDTIRLGEIYPSGDTAYISLLTFSNSDTSEITITVFDCFQTMYIPSGFTPDGDGINDEWYPIFTNIQELEWTIHSDEGNLVYDNLGELEARWDGTWNGNPAPEGLYRFDLRWFGYQDTMYHDRSGWLQLYRSE
ncbi:MAG: gliding motility-associated C-terminal domain-containing protein [Flavobacteriales bacterium]|nr:gliding motility-associated C-terminal domain-containing protein [Flavobacteriales bacterium]MCB9191794.1 gliding motility-associated C-terminal domain-containing protein [Flavobacteriales bacterium]